MHGVLSPGPYNSAYFEHSFLARHMGIELVLGPDLFVHDDRVFLKTTQGPKRVDVIYRRVDDDFLDPEAFRPESVLGVKGLMRPIAQATSRWPMRSEPALPTTRPIYPFVEDMIRFYLSEEPSTQECSNVHLCSAERSGLYARPLKNWWSKQSTNRAATGC